MLHRHISLALLLPFLAVACLGDETGYDIVEKPTVELFDGERFLSGTEELILTPSLGGSIDDEAGFIDIVNTGDAVLSITDIRVTGDPNGLYELSLDSEPSYDDPVLVHPKDTLKKQTSFRIGVHVDYTKLKLATTAKLQITTNPDKNGQTIHILSLKCQLLMATLTVNPSTLDFGTVYEGQTKELSLQLVNTGTDALEITAFHLKGDPGFSVLTDALPLADDKDDEKKDEKKKGDKAEPGMSLTIEPGQSQALTVRFTSAGPNPAFAELRLFSNDILAPNGTLVPIEANSGGPCILVTPTKLNFGGKLVGTTSTMDLTIASCGDEPLIISGAAISEQHVESFAVVPQPGQRFPMVMGINETAKLTISFLPPNVAPPGKDGQPEAFERVLSLITNTYSRIVEVGLSGYGVDTECPIAAIKATEGEEVCPQTKLHLIGSESFSPNGAITDYSWEVEQPDGSVSQFLPSTTAPDPTFTANVAGAYTFRLRVTDAAYGSTGNAICPDAAMTVLVIPCDAIHVELLWDTPNDPDQSDEGPEAGADLDLHFVHPFAQGEDIDGDFVLDGYFDNPFDTFWFNPNPNWGSMDPQVDDDASLDRDDTDGAGPENVNLNGPTDGLTYKVGVHVWNDHGFGASHATVRIYLHTVLVYEGLMNDLMNCDLWEVATISWPSGTITPITDKDGDPKIENFCSPFGWQ